MDNNPAYSGNGLELREYSPTEISAFGIKKNEYGPKHVYGLFQPGENEASGFVVIDNVELGPAIGGLRFAKDVDAYEVSRLARDMTAKNALTFQGWEKKYGGAKSGYRVNPHKLSNGQRKELVEAIAECLSPLENYIPGPDMGTNEDDMQLIFKKTGRAIGRPEERGGIPLDKLGLTALGVDAGIATIVEKGFTDLKKLEGSCFVMEGYGNVGKPLAERLNERGARLVAVSNHITDQYCGLVYHKNGLDVSQLSELAKEGKSVVDYKGAQLVLTGKNNLHHLFKIPSDILIPAARLHSITMDNVGDLQTTLVGQAANEPVTRDAENWSSTLMGIYHAPDIALNAGGVYAGGVEHQGVRDHIPALEMEQECREKIPEVISDNIETIFELARDENISHRKAALQIAERIIQDNKS